MELRQFSLRKAAILRHSSRRRVWSAVLTAVVLSLAGAAAQDKAQAGFDTERLSRIQQRMQEYVNAGEAAGIVTMVLRSGTVVQKTAVGMQNIEEKRSMREDSIFQIMSMTKPITAVGIMMLCEEGKISLFDEVQRYLPEFRDQMVNANGWLKKPSRAIRIGDLLSHTSGMRQMPQGDMKDIHWKMDHTLAEAVASFAKEPLEFEPGTKWLYSNTGFATLGRIIEVVSGQSYESFIQSRILQPLQMKDTFFYPPSDKLDRIAIVYAPKDGKEIRAGSQILGGDPGAFRKGSKYPGPEYGLFSTAEDLSHFCQMILNHGTWKGARILSPATIDTMREVQTGGMVAGWYPGADYGLAWEIITKPTGVWGLLPIGTFGHGGAFGTQEWMIPSRDMVTIFMVACEGDCSERPERAFQEMAISSLE
ncbi:MAG: serine hydrolase domain-containing protein [Candidatus Sulfotelmatobacter sp.]